MSVSVRALSEDEARLLTAARLVAVEHAPYLAHALFTARPVAAVGLDTFAVDRGWRLYLDPDTLAGWGPSLAGGVLVHEVSHLVRDHAARAEALGADYDNVASDLAINDDLLEARVPLPDGALTPATFGLDEGGIEEAYYAALAPKKLPHSNGSRTAGPATPSCGSGAGDYAADWELPSDDAACPALGSADAGMTRRLVAEAVGQHAARRSRGLLPAGWTRWADQTLAGPTIPWRRVLGAAMRRPLVTVAVVVDTSGSMGESEVNAAMAEVKGVIRAAGIGMHGLAVLACDAGVGARTRVRRVEDVQLVGGGGTDMRVGIAAAESVQPRPDVIVVLTDGCTPWPDTARS